jgi:hypothetical protein
VIDALLEDGREFLHSIGQLRTYRRGKMFGKKTVETIKTHVTAVSVHELKIWGK